MALFINVKGSVSYQARSNILENETQMIHVEIFYHTDVSKIGFALKST